MAPRRHAVRRGRGGSSAGSALTHVSTEAFKPKPTPTPQDTQLGAAPKPAPTTAASEPKATDISGLQVNADDAPDGESPEKRVDQQSYEGRRSFYLPQFFKNNLPVVNLCTRLINPETSNQYQREERTLIKRRFNLYFDLKIISIFLS